MTETDCYTTRTGSEKTDKEQVAIERLKTASEMSLAVYGLPLVVTTTGGKDSSVCVALAERAGIPFEVLHNHTTADAPETVYFIREEFRRLETKGIKCGIEYPVYKGKRASMWSMIQQAKNPPSRFRRYYCSTLKERGGSGRFIAAGVRWAESVKQKTTGAFMRLCKATRQATRQRKLSSITITTIAADCLRLVH